MVSRRLSASAPSETRRPESSFDNLSCPESSRPDFTDDEVDRLRRQCGNHPYQIQLLCRRALDRSDLDEAIESLTHDRAVSFFFAVDFELLNDTERTILRDLAESPGVPAAKLHSRSGLSSDTVTTSLGTLRDLGFVTLDDTTGHHEIASDFLRRWLVEGASAATPGAEEA